MPYIKSLLDEQVHVHGGQAIGSIGVARVQGNKAFW